MPSSRSALPVPSHVPPGIVAPDLATSGLMSLVGDTPLLRLQHITADLPPRVEVYAKAEWFNPGGSVKDRPAAAILQSALQSGALTAGKMLLDSTSGNMGISYATLGAALGVRTSLVVPSNASPERLAILRAYGVEIRLSDPTEGTDGARQVASELARRRPSAYYFADQYANPCNWQSHYRTTGPELVAGTSGRLTRFVAGLGTTGTMTGAGRYLKETLPDVRLIAVQPDGPIHGLEGLKHLPSSHMPEIFDASIPDETLIVTTEAAYDMARKLAREEGLLVGVSAAAAAVAAMQVAERLEAGVVVALFPDSGLKYLGASFWSAR